MKHWGRIGRSHPFMVPPDHEPPPVLELCVCLFGGRVTVTRYFTKATDVHVLTSMPCTYVPPRDILAHRGQVNFRTVEFHQ